MTTRPQYVCPTPQAQPMRCSGSRGSLQFRPTPPCLLGTASIDGDRLSLLTAKEPPFQHQTWGMLYYLLPLRCDTLPLPIDTAASRPQMGLPQPACHPPSIPGSPQIGPVLGSCWLQVVSPVIGRSILSPLAGLGDDGFITSSRLWS